MRFMILVKATQDTEAGVRPPEALFKEMTDYHEQLAKAGMLVDASGLQKTSQGWRIQFDGKRRSVIDGPFTETKELVAGYTIIRAASREQALEWTKGFPNPAVDGKRGEIEVRQLMDLEEFGDSPSISRFREILPTEA